MTTGSVRAAHVVQHDERSRLRWDVEKSGAATTLTFGGGWERTVSERSAPGMAPREPTGTYLRRFRNGPLPPAADCDAANPAPLGIAVPFDGEPLGATTC